MWNHKVWCELICFAPLVKISSKEFCKLIKKKMDETETSPFPILREPNIDDETSSANTEDHLISARVSSETISSTHRDGDTCCGFEKKRRKWSKWPIYEPCIRTLVKTSSSFHLLNVY